MCLVSKLALALALVPPLRAAPPAPAPAPAPAPESAALLLPLSSSSAAAIPPELLALPRAPLDRTRAPSRIAFGSCSNQRREQPIWDDVVSPRAPDLFVFLGDIVYADKAVFLKLRLPGSPADVAAAYATQLRDHAGYRRLVAAVPQLGVYDDHDTGVNDADRHVREDWRRAAQRLLLDFLGVAPEDARRGHEGAYSAETLGRAGGGEGGGVMQVVLLDNRFARDRYETWLGPVALPLLARQRPQDMLGEAQWAFLETELARGAPGGAAPADVLLIGSGLQFVSANDPWVAESWSKLPQSRARLLALLALHNRSRTVLLSGDVHFGEISRTRCAFLGYPLYDATSSGLTHSWGGNLKRAVIGWSMLAATRVTEAAASAEARSWIGGRGWTNSLNVGGMYPRQFPAHRPEPPANSP